MEYDSQTIYDEGYDDGYAAAEKALQPTIDSLDYALEVMREQYLDLKATLKMYRDRDMGTDDEPF